MSYRVPEQVIVRPVQDEVMILDTRTNQYLGLNGTGTVVWSVLAQGEPASVAVDELVARYEIAREVAQGDVMNLVDELRRLSLIVPSEP